MAQGTVQLKFALVGEDKLANTIQTAQRSMDRFGKRAKGSADGAQRGFMKLTGTIGGLPGKITELNQGLQLMRGVAQVVGGALRGAFDFLKSGEIANNVDKVFAQINASADRILERGKSVTFDLLDETTTKQQINRMRLMGASAEDAVKILEIAAVRHIATGEGIESIAQKIAAAAVSGRASTLKMSGVFVDLAKETKITAEQMGILSGEMSDQEVISSSIAAIYRDVMGGLVDMGLDVDSLGTGLQSLKTTFADYESALQQFAARTATELLGVGTAAEKMAAELDRLAQNATRLPERMAKMWGAQGSQFDRGLRIWTERTNEARTSLVDLLNVTPLEMPDFIRALNEGGEAWVDFLISADKARHRLALEEKKKDIAAVEEERAAAAAKIKAGEKLQKDNLASHKEWQELLAKQEKDREAAAKKGATAKAKAAAKIEKEKADLKIKIQKQNKHADDLTFENKKAALAEISKIEAEEFARARKSKENLAALERGDIIARALPQQEAIDDRKHLAAVSAILDEQEAARIRLMSQTKSESERESARIHSAEMERLKERQDTLIESSTIMGQFSSEMSRYDDQWSIVMGGVADITGEVANNLDNTAKAAHHGIGALGRMTSALIKSDKEAALTRAAFATAQGFFAIGAGQPWAATSYFTSAALFAAMAGSSGKRGGGRRSGAGGSTIGGGGGGGGGRGGSVSSKTNNVIVNVQGLIHGSSGDLGASMAQQLNGVQGTGLGSRDV